MDSDRRFDIRLANSNYFSLGHQARAVALALIKHYDKPFAEIAREAGLEGDSKTLKRILRNKQFQRVMRYIVEPVVMTNLRLDCLHFLLSLALELDMDEEGIYQMYMTKMATNYSRQAKGGY